MYKEFPYYVLRRTNILSFHQMYQQRIGEVLVHKATDLKLTLRVRESVAVGHREEVRQYVWW